MSAPADPHRRHRQLIRQGRILGALTIVLLLVTSALIWYLLTLREDVYKVRCEGLNNVIRSNDASITKLQNTLNQTLIDNVETIRRDVKIAIDEMATFDQTIGASVLAAHVKFNATLAQSEEELRTFAEAEVSQERIRVQERINATSAGELKIIEQRLTTIEDELCKKIDQEIDKARKQADPNYGTYFLFDFNELVKRSKASHHNETSELQHQLIGKVPLTASLKVHYGPPTEAWLTYGCTNKSMSNDPVPAVSQMIGSLLTPAKITRPWPVPPNVLASCINPKQTVISVDTRKLIDVERDVAPNGYIRIKFEVTS